MVIGSLSAADEQGHKSIGAHKLVELTDPNRETLWILEGEGTTWLLVHKEKLLTNSFPLPHPLHIHSPVVEAQRKLREGRDL
jgi:hypothetical protein